MKVLPFLEGGTFNLPSCVRRRGEREKGKGKRGDIGTAPEFPKRNHNGIPLFALPLSPFPFSLSPTPYALLPTPRSPFPTFVKFFSKECKDRISTMYKIIPLARIE
jgi:hypothetical protein